MEFDLENLKKLLTEPSSDTQTKNDHSLKYLKEFQELEAELRQIIEEKNKEIQQLKEYIQNHKCPHIQELEHFKEFKKSIQPFDRLFQLMNQAYQVPQAHEVSQHID